MDFIVYALAPNVRELPHDAVVICKKNKEFGEAIGNRSFYGNNRTVSYACIASE